MKQCYDTSIGTLSYTNPVTEPRIMHDTFTYNELHISAPTTQTCMGMHTYTNEILHCVQVRQFQCVTLVIVSTSSAEIL